MLTPQQTTGTLRAAPDTDFGSSDESFSSVTAAQIAERVLKQLDDEKAEDIVTIDLLGKSDVADTLVIASGRSQRHVGAMADKLVRLLKDEGLVTAKVEGLPACDWVLIDAGDVIIHLFRPEVRSFYNLERIWAPERFAPAQ
ncbi:MAG: ribosome silencing factor [Parvularcula sp.]|nr:ribosome silencing factor [Parvularcula sp.]